MYSTTLTIILNFIKIFLLEKKMSTEYEENIAYKNGKFIHYPHIDKLKANQNIKEINQNPMKSNYPIIQTNDQSLIHE